MHPMSVLPLMHSLVTCAMANEYILTIMNVTTNTPNNHKKTYVQQGTRQAVAQPQVGCALPQSALPPGNQLTGDGPGGQEMRTSVTRRPYRPVNTAAGLPVCMKPACLRETSLLSVLLSPLGSIRSPQTQS